MLTLRRVIAISASGLCAVLGTLASPALGTRAAVAGFAYPAGAANGYATVAFTIKVPRARAASSPTGARRVFPQYISASTKSFVILTDGQNPVVAGVNPATGYARIGIKVAVGTHIFTVTAYDQPAGKGNVLSTGSTAPVYVPATGTTVRLTLEGVAASVKLQLEQTHATIGFPATIFLDVLTLDADGNTILQGTVLTQPFTLTSSDRVNGKLSQTIVTTAPIDDHSFNHPISVAYNGANVSQITFSATGGGLRTVTPTVLVPLQPPAAGRQLIVSGNPIAAFSASGIFQLLTTIGATPPGTTGLGAAAVDSGTNLLYQTANYVTTTPTGSFNRTRIAVYRISGGFALTDFFQPSINPEGVAVDSATHTIYISDTIGQEVQIVNTSSGHAVVGTIGTGFNGAFGPDLAIDSNVGRLFVSEDGGGGGLKAFSTTPPYTDLGYLAYGAHGAAAVDSVANRLYVVDFDRFNNGYVDVYNTATFALLTTIGPFPYPTIPLGIAVDPTTQHLFVAIPVAKALPTFDDTSAADTIVAVYGLGTGLSFPLLTTFTAAGDTLTVAPTRSRNGARTLLGVRPWLGPGRCADVPVGFSRRDSHKN